MAFGPANSPPDMRAPEATALPPVLGRLDALAMVVGSVIGSGIFLKPGIAAKSLHSPGLILLVWVVVGLVTLCGALSVAELTAMLPRAGGPYVYLRVAYGEIWAFLLGWVEMLVVRPASIGALSVATAIYLGQLAPRTTTELEAITIAIVCLLSLVNALGAKWGAWVQIATTLLKAGFLVFLILLPWSTGHADPSHLVPLWPESMSGNILAGFLVAMINVMWPYDGWITVTPVAEEVRDPQRTVPLALAAGVGIVTALYVGANVAYLLALPLEQIAASDAVAATMCRALLGPVGASIVSAGVLCSTLGAVNANILSGPRVYFAMARDRLLPASLARVHPRFETPANAILLQGIWSLTLIVAVFAISKQPRDAFDSLTNFAIFGGLLFYAMAVGAVYVLRWRRPELPRPYRTWGYPIVPAIYLVAFGFAIVGFVAFLPRETAAGIALVLAGALVYAFRPRRI